MKINRTLFLCLIIALPAINIFTQTKPKIDNDAQTDFFGAIGEGVYRNGFFGFTVNFPKNWSVLNQEQINPSLQIGQDILKGNSRAMEEAARKEILILMLTEKSKTLENTSSLILGVRKQPNAATSETVVDATKKLFLNNLDVKLVKDTQKLKLGGENFSTVELQNNWQGEYVYQKFFTTIRKSYSLTFVLTYKKTESLQAMENIMQSLSFTN